MVRLAVIYGRARSAADCGLRENEARPISTNLQLEQGPHDEHVSGDAGGRQRPADQVPPGRLTPPGTGQLQFTGDGGHLQFTLYRQTHRSGQVTGDTCRSNPVQTDTQARSGHRGHMQLALWTDRQVGSDH